MKNRLKNNTRLFYIFRFFARFAMTEGVWVLYMLSKGLSLWQVGALEGVYHAAALLTEVPSGAIADLLGRKKVLVVSRLLAFASSIPMIMSDNFFVLAFGFALTGFSGSLISGTEDALIYDTYLALGEERRFLGAMSRLGFVAEVSGGIAVLAGGMIAKRSYQLCYLVEMGITVLSVAICFLLCEPETEKRREKRPTLREHFRASTDVIRGDRDVRRLIIHYSLLETFYVSVYFYSQELYRSLGFDEAGISIILLGAGAAASVGALLCERTARRLGRHTEFAAGASLALGIAVMGVPSVPTSLAGFALASAASAMLSPLGSAELNRRIPSERRATLISVKSMCFSVGMIVLFPLTGALGDTFTLARLLVLLGAALGVYVTARNFAANRGR